MLGLCKKNYRPGNIEKVHDHPLKIEKWQKKYKQYCCNICKGRLPDIFLQCEECDYDICYKCFNGHFKEEYITYYIINI